VRLELDTERCTGHGRCYTLAPEVFGGDESGYGILLVEGDVPPDREETARSAALNCPERAITILD
jgi:ferredoxin